VTRAVIFPELLSGREDEDLAQPWIVREGSTNRGAASCDLAARILEVPLDLSEQARVVRAHELMHARVSPHAHHLERALDEVSPRALECAEELRVNTLLGRLDFDVSLLRDGTEKMGGRRLGEAGEWAEALCFMLAVLGTGAEKDYLAGIRLGCPSWLAPLRAVRKRALTVFAQSTHTLARTRFNDEGLPSGYACSTLVLARALSRAMEARVPMVADELRSFRRSLEPGGRRPATGKFAPLVFDESLARRSRPSAASVRVMRPSMTGVAMRYPGRFLTDEHRRAFAQRARRHGGIVVIDQSGSMDLDGESLRTLLRDAPAALVVGYSHRPGDRGATPNVWLLCDRGTVATTWPSGNVGNGVDGPVLHWAIAQRRANEPVVWVTDGQVTDSHDHPDEALTEECATLVRRHRIRLARDLTEATKTIQSNLSTPRSRLANFGRVGHCLLETGAMWSK